MKLFRGGLCLLAILVPLSLLVQPRAIFYPPFDWNNNLWLIAYFAEYFRHHLGMPTEVNLVSAAGMTMPLFYGYLLYPVLGFVAVFVGADLALRLGCLAVVALQFYALLSAGREVFRHRGLAYAAAVAVVWSTYALTDLYNRAAIAEFFATGFLMAAIGFGVAAAAATTGTKGPFYGWMAGVAAALAIGIHPPTAVVSGVFLAAVGLSLAGAWATGLAQGFSIRPRGGRRVRRFGGAGPGALVLSYSSDRSEDGLVGRSVHGPLLSGTIRFLARAPQSGYPTIGSPLVRERSMSARPTWRRRSPSAS